MTELVEFIESEDRSEKRIVILHSDLEDLKRTLYDNGSHSARDLAESEWSMRLESLKNDHATAMSVLRKKLRTEREQWKASLARAEAVQDELRKQLQPLRVAVTPVRKAPVMPTLEMAGIGSRDYTLPSFGGNDQALAALGRRTLSMTPGGKNISAFLSEAISSDED